MKILIVHNNYGKYSGEETVVDDKVPDKILIYETNKDIHKQCAE